MRKIILSKLFKTAILFFAVFFLVNPYAMQARAEDTQGDRISFLFRNLRDEGVDVPMTGDNGHLELFIALAVAGRKKRRAQRV